MQGCCRTEISFNERMSKIPLMLRFSNPKSDRENLKLRQILTHLELPPSMLAFLLANLLKGLNVIIQAPEGPTLLTPLSESPAQLGTVSSLQLLSCLAQPLSGFSLLRCLIPSPRATLTLTASFVDCFRAQMERYTLYPITIR